MPHAVTQLVVAVLNASCSLQFVLHAFQQRAPSPTIQCAFAHWDVRSEGPDGLDYCIAHDQCGDRSTAPHGVKAHALPHGGYLPRVACCELGCVCPKARTRVLVRAAGKRPAESTIGCALRMCIQTVQIRRNVRRNGWKFEMHGASRMPRRMSHVVCHVACRRVRTALVPARVCCCSCCWRRGRSRSHSGAFARSMAIFSGISASICSSWAKRLSFSLPMPIWMGAWGCACIRLIDGRYAP
jgi:hypothetical protein